MEEAHLIASDTQRAAPVRDVVHDELLLDCVHCDLCVEACPTYLDARTDMHSRSTGFQPVMPSPEEQNHRLEACATWNSLSVVVHPGCVAQVLAPTENANSEALLAKAGYRIAHVDVPCCGALDLHAGNRERA